MATTNFYKDLPLDFIPNPITGDIRPVVDDVAIKKSLSNLIKTRRGSKPFYPEYGSDIEKFAFGHADAFTIYNIEKSVYDTITRFEDRVVPTEVTAKITDNGIEIRVFYRIRNTTLNQVFTTTVARTA